MTRKFVVGTLALLIGAVLFVFWLGTDITSGLQTQQTPIAEPPKLTVPFTDKESEAQERVEAASANLDFASKESAQTHEIRLCDKADGVNAALEQAILQAKDVDFVQQFKQSNALASQWAYTSVAELTPKRKSQTLAKLANDNPSNQVVYYDLMLSCLSSDAECAPSIFARGTEIHGQNGAFWLLSAIDHINHQREEMAISALRQAAFSPVYDELWGEHFALFEEAVRATPVQSDIGQQMTVMGLMAASTNMPYNEIMALCKGAGLNRLDIKEVCIQVGQRLETGENTALSKLIGLAIQERMYEHFNDDVLLQRVQEKGSALMRLNQDFAQAQLLMLQNERRTRDMFTKIKELGELQTMEYVVQEAYVLSADPNFDPCAPNW